MGSWWSRRQEKEDYEVPHVKTGNLEFERKFRIAMDTTTMSEHAKTQILIRYMSVTRRYIIRRRRIECLYNTLRGIIIMGGLLTPALITVMPQVCDSGFDPWVPTLIFSLGVSLSNAAIETFGIVRMYYTFLATEGVLVQEGWNFLSLTGRYSKYDAHTKCWRKFMYHVNLVEAQAINRQILFETKQRSSDSGVHDHGVEEAKDLVPVFDDVPTEKSESEERKQVTVPENVKAFGFRLDFD